MTGTELDGYGYKRNNKLYRRHKLQDLINFIFIHLGKQSTTLSGLLMLLLYFRGRMLRYLSHRAPRDIIKNAGIYVITIEPREHYDSVSRAKTMSYRKRTQGMVSIRHAHNPPKEDSALVSSFAAQCCRCLHDCFSKIQRDFFYLHPRALLLRSKMTKGIPNNTSLIS